MKSDSIQKNFYSIISSYPMKLISKSSPFFPIALNNLTDCPDILFIIGNEKILNQFSIAMVGTRNSSEEGNRISFEFAKNLAQQNIIVVSGLANGIDTHSHLGAISSGKTIAILAYGFQYIPSQKLSLLNEILASGGAVISEYFPDTPPQKFFFLRRNRLIAAISKALIVIQAPEKSGALNTAQIAMQLKKPVFAIPWSINTFRGIGSNNLLQNGAYFLTNVAQVLDYFNISSPISLEAHSEKLTLKKKTVPTYISDDFKKIYQFILQHISVSKEQIFEQFYHETIADLNAKLLIMELNHWIIKEKEMYSIK